MTLNLPEWQAVIAIAVSALGLMATLYTAFGSTARRLRSDLASDTELVVKLEGAVQEDLQGTITDRAYRLVAATRFPPLTWYEVALTFILLPVFWLFFTTPAEIRTTASEDELMGEVLGPGQAMLLAIAFVTYGALVRSWSGRASARVAYVHTRIGDDAARALARLLAFPAHLVPVAFALTLVVAVIANVSDITAALSWPLWSSLLISFPVSALVIVVTVWIGLREDLSDQIRFYTDIMYIGADIPRLRPVELGRTDEDVQRYLEAFERRFPGRQHPLKASKASSYTETARQPDTPPADAGDGESTVPH